jgi:hypothetical protein
MSVTINGTSGVTFNDASNQTTAATGFGFKNRIINGAMVIDQRNAGASGTGSGVYTIDRWYYSASQSSKLTWQQNAGSVTPPAGFINYLGATSSSAYSVLTGDYFSYTQYVEGLNTADLAWGTASAATITLSFWVRSSLTGTFGGSLRNSAGNRSYPFSYTISASNTWEQKSVTIAGDTSGTWLTTNGIGIAVNFGLGVGTTFSGTAGAWAGANYVSATGATSVVGTNGATFYITGVQLEKGSTATSFDYRPYSTELQLAQRYYYKTVAEVAGDDLAVGSNATTTTSRVTVFFPTQMRTPPTALEQSGTAGDYSVRHAAATTTCSSVPTFFNANKNCANTQLTVSSGLTAGQGSFVRAVNTSAYLAWSAEL